MEYSRVRVLVLALAVAALYSAVVADTVTLAPPEGATTNVLSLITGDTAVEVAGPGAVKLNPSNMHIGGTTLSGGTLILSGDIPAGGPSPVGTGTFTVSGGTLRGTGSFGGDITGTGAATLAGDGKLTLSGNNNFQSGVAISEGVVEISGGTVTSGARIDLGTVSGKSATLRISGGSITSTSSGNLQRGYAANTESVLVMTGGTFDVGGNNSVVGFNGGPVTARTDIAGTAALRNIGNFYIHADGGSSSVNEISVHDGGTFGFVSLYDNASASTTLSVDGGTLANDTTGIASARTSSNNYGWIRNNITSFKVGPSGVTFTTDNGAGAGLAQIRMPILAEAASEGETAKGVTFKTGNWGYYVAGNDYEGPTVIRNGAALFLYSNGTIPSGSVVTVASGGELCVCGAENKSKTVSSLVLQDGAILGFGLSLNTLTASSSVTFPAHAKIALYNNANPTTGKNNTDGTYAVLKVPASYADALRAVSWTCATATSGKSYTFSVATSGDTATLSMTIAADSSGAITGTSNLNADDYSVDSNITINNSGTLVAKKNIYGSATGGSITINNGGTLDASAGNIRPVDASGNSFHLYLNEGGALVARSIEGKSSLATTTPMFHFNGGTIYPVGLNTSDGNRYYLRYQPAIVGAHGLFIDMSKWVRPDGYDSWVRASIQSNIYHDPDCVGVDGGITVKAAGDDKAVVYFGGSFAGSGLNGGILAEKGAIVSAHATAFGGQTVALASGSRFRPFSDATVNVADLTIGSNGASEAVRLDLPSNSVSAPGIAVSGTLSVLSPVEVAFTGSWNDDSTVSAGVYTALVYQAASPALDTSLFTVPPGFSISSETVAINTGDYNGYTALVLTLAQDDLSLDDSAEKTISADATYGNIYVGDFGVVANNTLTVSDGTVTADTLHLAYQPGIGTSAEDGIHLDAYNQTGGKVSVQTLQTHWVGENSDDTAGRADTEINISGGLLEVAGNVELGYNRMKSGRTSTINVSGGRLAVGGDMLLIRYSGGVFSAAGILNITGGEVDVKGVVDLSRTKNQASGTKNGGIWLHGGILKAENVIQTTNDCPYAHFYFDGGVYAPYGAAAANRTMQGLNEAYVSTNGAIIDTSALPAGETYTIAQALLTDPALDGAEDGGLVKKGAGTLALSGANTFTGPVKVEAGTLGIANSDALSGYVEVADGAVLDLDETGATVASIAASGAVAGNLTVTDAVVLANNGSVLSVGGDLTFGDGAAIDFGLAEDEEVPSGWTPVAAVSGEITLQNALRVRNAGDFNRCRTSVSGGVLYVRPFKSGTLLIIR